MGQVEGWGRINQLNLLCERGERVEEIGNATCWKVSVCVERSMLEPGALSALYRVPESQGGVEVPLFRAHDIMTSCDAGRPVMQAVTF